MSFKTMETAKKGVQAAIPFRSLLPPRRDMFPQNSIDHSPPETRALTNTDINSSLGHDFSRISVMPAKSPVDMTGSQPVAQPCPLGLASPRACPFGGACHTCPATVQTKLKISQPRDVYEQEADRVADTVMMLEPPVMRRAAHSGSNQPNTVPPMVHEVQRSPGQPLDPDTRAFMEQRFGYDFSQVRVHTNERAAVSARAVDARAYIVGRNMVFGPGQYAPHATEGQKLISHELTHVVQQREWVSGGDLRIAPTHDRYEDEAERSATSLSRMHKVSSAPAGMVQRQFVTPLAAGGGFGGLMERDRKRVYSGEPTEEEKTYNYWIKFAQSLETIYPGWRSILPNCPCTVDEARKSSEFQEDRWWVTLILNWGGYHPGAVDSFRTKKGYQSKPGTSHGQQCIYDGKGRLITDGPGAGTPDLWSPETNYDEHQKFDVKPFDILGWEVYNRYWIPNDGGPLCQGTDFPLPSDKTRRIA